MRVSRLRRRACASRPVAIQRLQSQQFASDHCKADPEQCKLGWKYVLLQIGGETLHMSEPCRQLLFVCLLLLCAVVVGGAVFIVDAIVIFVVVVIVIKVEAATHC